MNNLKFIFLGIDSEIISENIDWLTYCSNKNARMNFTGIINTQSNVESDFRSSILAAQIFTLVNYSTASFYKPVTGTRCSR